MRPRRRAPGAHARVGARLQHIDRGLRAVLVGAGVLRHPFFVGAPAELGRLHALGDEALDRPGIDELAHGLGGLGALGVALGDMNALDACIHHQPGPFLLRFGLFEGQAEIGGQVQQGLLHEPGHHARIGPAAGHRGRPARLLAPRLEQLLAQIIVGAAFGAFLRVEIEAGPGLHDRVDIERADLAAQLHHRDRGDIDREIHAEAAAFAGGEQRREQLAVVLFRHGLMDEADAVLVQQLLVLVLGIDDDEALLVVFEVTLDQRQRALADRAEADHHDRAVDFAVDRPFGHESGIPVGVFLKSHAARAASISGVRLWVRQRPLQEPARPWLSQFRAHLRAHRARARARGNGRDRMGPAAAIAR